MVPERRPRVMSSSTRLRSIDRDLPHSPANGVLTLGELDAQCHHHPTAPIPAERDVAARQADQGVERFIVPVNGRPHLLLPGAPGPRDHGTGEILLVREEVIQRSTRVSGFGGDVSEIQAAVAVA